MRTALTLAAAALLAAACGGTKGDERVDQGGPFDAPQVGAGGNVNGRGMTDSNAARPAATSGTGAPSSAGIATNGDASTSVAVPQAGTVPGGTYTGGAAGSAEGGPRGQPGKAGGANAGGANAGGTKQP